MDGHQLPRQLGLVAVLDETLAVALALDFGGALEELVQGAVLGDQLLRVCYVIRPSDIRQRHIVHTLGDPETEVLPVFVGQRGGSDGRAGEIDALIRGNRSTRDDHTLDHVTRDPFR